MADDPLVVVSRMVRDDDDAVLSGQELLRELFALQTNLVMPHGWDYGNIRIVVGDEGPTLLQELKNLQSGRFARVIDVLLISDAENADPAPLDRLALVIQSLGHAVHDVLRHGRV